MNIIVILMLRTHRTHVARSRTYCTQVLEHTFSVRHSHRSVTVSTCATIGLWRPTTHLVWGRSQTRAPRCPRLVGDDPCNGSLGVDKLTMKLCMPATGVVFHYRSHTGRYTFNFSEAQLACQSVGGSIASPQQLQAAYESGYHQCDAGWLLDQTVRYSIVLPRDKCAGDLGDQPGVRSYGMRPADERYDVYCYIEELRGEVFHVESAQGLTYDQAVLSCQEHGGILASTGELYAAWKTGFDKCRAGWLQDGSVRYPINIPRARCGGGKHGVHTVYAHPNQTVYQENIRHTTNYTDYTTTTEPLI
uniref:Link domain-containing protein n=1 Tax=Oryzias latipes TaxID=8090 RepID=A0A3P9K5A0_ORYLA